MKLIEYLRSIDPMSFIVCININCDAFNKICNGTLNKETIDQITFFSGSAANVLKNGAALDLFSDLKILDVQKERKPMAEADLIYLYVNYAGNYSEAKQKAQMILA